MKINYKEYVVIGNAGEEQKVITNFDDVFDGTAQVFADYCKAFEAEVNFYHRNKIANANGFQVMLREDPEDALNHIENQKCVVTDFWDSEEEVWKHTVKMVKIVEE